MTTQPRIRDLLDAVPVLLMTVCGRQDFLVQFGCAFRYYRPRELGLAVPAALPPHLGAARAIGKESREGFGPGSRVAARDQDAMSLVRDRVACGLGIEPENRPGTGYTPARGDRRCWQETGQWPSHGFFSGVA